MDQRHAWVVFPLVMQNIKILALAQVQRLPLETSDEIRPMMNRINERRHGGDRCRHNGWALCSRSLPSRLPPRLALPEVPGTSFGHMQQAPREEVSGSGILGISKLILVDKGGRNPAIPRKEAKARNHIGSAAHRPTI